MAESIRHRGVTVGNFFLIPLPASLDVTADVATIATHFRAYEYRRETVHRVVHYQWPRLRRGVVFEIEQSRPLVYIGFRTLKCFSMS